MNNAKALEVARMLTITRDDQDCAERILDHCGNDWQAIARLVAKHRSDFTEDLRVQVDNLRAQLAERDEQLAAALDTARKLDTAFKTTCQPKEGA